MNPTLTIAEGYLELDLPEQAEAELENLEGDDRTSIEVWVLRCKIYKATEQWELMKEVAKHLVSLDPKQSQHWVWAAIATRKAENVEAAHLIMQLGKNLHPGAGLIHYYLACYASQLGRIDEAKEHFQNATWLIPDLRQVGLDEPDLEPIWESVIG